MNIWSVIYSTLRNLCYEYVQNWRFGEGAKLYFKHILDLIGKRKYQELFQFTNAHSSKSKDLTNPPMYYDPADLNMIAPSSTSLREYSLPVITQYGPFFDMLPPPLEVAYPKCSPAYSRSDLSLDAFLAIGTPPEAFPSLSRRPSQELCCRS
jgi:hypothetical protein